MPLAGGSFSVPMAGAKKSRKVVRRQHLKYVGVAKQTMKRYRQAVHRFFLFLVQFELRMPQSVEELDEKGGEFINHLFQDDYPIYYATDFLSGLKRLFPRCRNSMFTSRQYHANWLRTVTRTRATPASPELVIAVRNREIVTKETEEEEETRAGRSK